MIEIGAGRGALTEPALRKSKHLIAIEADPYLAGRLESKLGPSLEVVQADFLHFDLPQNDYVVLGNIPYHISTDIIRRLISGVKPPEEAWLVVQSELGKRMAGLPYSKESLWSLRLKPHWHMELPDRLAPEEFSPPPSVDSVLLHLSKRPKPIVSTEDYSAYLNFVKLTLKHSGRVDHALRAHFTKQQIQRLTSDFHLNPTKQLGELMFEQWLGLFRFHRKLNKP